MDLKEIKRLISIVEEAKISEFSIEHEGMKVKISKKTQENGHMAHVYAPQQFDVAVPQGSQQAPIEPAQPEVDNTLIPIKSQMVGTFYATPNPDSPTFVKVGDSIAPGKVVCIIEAMKLFNEIEAEVSGTIEKVCVENGTPVEFGQDLFLVRPA